MLATECEWFLVDLFSQGVPHLLRADGGPFDVVTPHVRRLSQANHQLYLTHGPTREGRGAKNMVRLDHEVVAIILWSALGAGAREQVDQANVEAAVAKVVARVLGPDGDVGHGGRWFSIGPASVEPVNPLDRLRWSDAISAAGAAHVVAVRYTVTEFGTR